MSSRPDRRSLSSSRFRLMLAASVLGAFVSAPSQAVCQSGTAISAAVEKRMATRVPAEDKLLYGLESDFLELLASSPHVDELLKAEQLLASVNDNSRWTHYAQATRILRQTADAAAIPLLLRYIVEHSRRSSAHVMIPEYASAITVIAGKALPSPYSSGPDLEARMRSKVEEIVAQWWVPEKEQIAARGLVRNRERWNVIAAETLKKVRSDGDFTGSGGAPDSAYGAYHNVYYRMLARSDDRYQIPSMEPELVDVILQKYRGGDKSGGPPYKLFPFEAIVVLAKAAREGERDAIIGTVESDSEPDHLRLICSLALFRAGERLRTPLLIEISDRISHLETRLVLLSSLRWAGLDAVPTLLQSMEHPNREVATVAACALGEIRPAEAIPHFRRLLEGPLRESPTLLLSALAEYETMASREILANLIETTLATGTNRRHLDRFVSALVEACDFEKPLHSEGGLSSAAEARLALDRYASWKQKRRHELEGLNARVKGLEARVELARQILRLRGEDHRLLLQMQGQHIGDPAQTEAASQMVRAAETELDSIQNTLSGVRARRDELLQELNR